MIVAHILKKHISIITALIISFRNNPNIFMPHVSPSSDITEDIYSSGASTLWFVYSGRLEFESDEQLQALNVERNDLLTSSDEALFITNLNQSALDAANSAELAAQYASYAEPHFIIADNELCIADPDGTFILADNRLCLSLAI